MLEVSNLWKAYLAEGKQVPALRGVSFTIQEGEFYTLLGPSGCGKSTTLRCVAGLEHPERGEIRIKARAVFSTERKISVPAFKRDVGMVFQSYAIWPHMSVFQNVAFPLTEGKNKCLPGEVGPLVEQALSLVRLGGLGDRPASLLSGGQQQRVALARALVCRPSLLLLDEPLSNLDARLRDEMRKEIKRLAQTLRVTTLYVTHDQVEALSLSDRIGVMKDGVIVQEGTPSEIYFSPRDEFIAGFVGRANLVEGVLVAREEDSRMCLVQTPLGHLRGVGLDPMQEGDPVLFSIRPGAATLFPVKPGIETNILEGKVEVMTFTGESSECQVRVGDSLLEVVDHSLVALRPGQKVYLHAVPERCVVLHAAKV